MFGALFLSPNFMLSERIMVGIPVKLFGGNQRGIYSFITLPSDENLNG